MTIKNGINGYIYKIISPSKKIYIGQTINLYFRKNKYKNLNCKNQIKIYNSLLKYGWDNHIFEIIEEINIDKLIEREDYWINFYDSINKGLNCIGSFKNIISEETRKKMSDSAKGNINSKGHILSEETKEILRKKGLGNKNRKGKKSSEKTKEKNRLASLCNKNRKGKKISEESKKIISISKTKPENNLPILVYDKQMNFICEYENKMMASLDLKNKGYKITTGAIWQVCKGKKKSYIGFIFKFKI